MKSSDGPTADVLLAVRGPHEERLAQEFSAVRASVRVVRRCADLAELIAAATAGIGSAALICAEQQDFDREVVAELQTVGITTVALVVDTEGWQADRMRALGVDSVCRLDATSAELEAALTAPPRSAQNASQLNMGATGTLHLPGTSGSSGSSGTPGALSRPGLRGSPSSDSSVQQQEQQHQHHHGQIIAIWGPGGAPGRTSLAINLATELAATPPPAGRRKLSPQPTAEVLLVDADTYNPSLAQHLALLDESAGLAVAARAAGQGRLDLVRLAELTPKVDRHLRVLSGIGRSVRWPEVPSSSLEVLWERSRELADFIIVDTASQIESDEALTYDTRAPQRNGATLSALAAADVVIVIAGADPIAIQRLVRALADLEESGLAVRAQQLVVLNRVRNAVVGTQPEKTLRDALARYAAVNVDVMIPDDPTGFDSALLAGRTLAEVQPHSPARRAIAELGEHVRQIASLTPVGG